MGMGYAPRFPPFLALPSSFLPCLRSSHHCFGLCWLVGLGVALVFLLALARLVAGVQWASLADRRVGVYVAAAKLVHLSNNLQHFMQCGIGVRMGAHLYRHFDIAIQHHYAKTIMGGIIL